MADKANTQAGTAAPKKRMTKMEAVRRAMRELGKDAQPSKMQGFIKERFGIDMTPNHISACKGEIRRKKAGKAKSAGKKTPSPKPPAKGKGTAQAPASRAAGTAALSIPDIEAIKTLVRRVGADQLRALVDLLAR
ncbi:MAG: hypothetical protein HYS12_19420 [Planctomycetes bacterium]|nr:hypothetical protein [Planctomycetota bacterium]